MNSQKKKIRMNTELLTMLSTPLYILVKCLSQFLLFIKLGYIIIIIMVHELLAIFKLLVEALTNELLYLLTTYVSSFFLI